eukprot:COSAG01_NODE_19696_length_995_cov_1.131696_1_plen_67_part_10
MSSKCVINGPMYIEIHSTTNCYHIRSSLQAATPCVVGHSDRSPVICSSNGVPFDDTRLIQPHVKRTR